jgi:type VI secretion system secreted protein VgrG
MNRTTSHPFRGDTTRQRAAHRRARSSPIVFLALVAGAAIAGAWPVAALAATQPDLKTAANYAVLAGQSITNTGNSVINGNLGIDPNGASSVTGFPPGTYVTEDAADAAALQAQSDLTAAYNDAASASSNDNLTGKDLGGQNLTPGVYTFSSSAQLTGTLTLSGNGVFIFQIGSTLTTASNAVVNLTNGAQSCAVYWQVGSSATLGTGTQFQGNLMALASITMNTGADLTGRALAQTASLTMDDNAITPPSGTCTVTVTTYTAPVSASTTATTASAPDTGAAASNFVILGVLLVLGGGLVLASMVRRTHRARR